MPTEDTNFMPPKAFLQKHSKPIIGGLTAAFCGLVIEDTPPDPAAAHELPPPLFMSNTALVSSFSVGFGPTGPIGDFLSAGTSNFRVTPPATYGPPGSTGPKIIFLHPSSTLSAQNHE